MFKDCFNQTHSGIGISYGKNLGNPSILDVLYDYNRRMYGNLRDLDDSFEKNVSYNI